MATSTNAGAHCPAAQVQDDMAPGFVPTGPEQNLHRTGGVGSATFCAAPAASAVTLNAGTTTVAAWFANTNGSTCNITATLSINGTAMGAGSVTIPSHTVKQLFSWSFATSAGALNAGDQLTLGLVWQSVRACNFTDLYWNGASSGSAVSVP